MESAKEEDNTASCDDNNVEEDDQEDDIIAELESEAKSRAVKHISGLLRRSEQLEKVTKQRKNNFCNIFYSCRIWF